MSPPGWFVTGTDTGVGKTVVACALLRALRERGIDAGAMKPIETGVGPEGPLDAIALREAAGACDPLGDICPQTFSLPAAPLAAAEREEREVDLGAVRASFERLAGRHEVLVVEGAGGLLVPIASGVDMADLAAQLRLPLLVVARAALGTINHTRLTLEAAAARELPVAGVVICHTTGTLPASEAENLELLRRELGERLVGEIPPLAPGDRPEAGAVDTSALLERIRE